MDCLKIDPTPNESVFHHIVYFFIVFINETMITMFDLQVLTNKISLKLFYYSNILGAGLLK